MDEEFKIWKDHFIDQAHGLIPHEKRFYKVSTQKGRGVKPNIKLISPTEQIVERAKSSLSNPPEVYDPVTGTMQTKKRPRQVKNSRKRRKKKEQKGRGGKKRKICKPKKKKKKKKKKPRSKKKKTKKWYT